MRIDAAQGASGWTVLHVPTCRVVRRVRWVDDETAQYAVHVPTGMVWTPFELDVRQATRIVILPAPRKLILIDPVDDGATDARDVSTSKPRDIAHECST